MDRRSFLKTSGGAAAATAGGAALATVPVEAHEIAAPAVEQNSRELRMALAWPLEMPVLGDSVRRLARRIETAAEHRFRFQLIASDKSGLEAVQSGAADLYYGSEDQHAQNHPALAYFAGVPRCAGFDPAEHDAWLMAGGGQMLWDDLAGGLGIKPLLGGAAVHAGFWFHQPKSAAADMAGLRICAAGLTADVVRRLGGQPVDLSAREIAPALGSGHIDGAQGFGPLADMALGLHNAAAHYVESAAAGSWAITLGVRRECWDSLSEADQTIIRACAAEEMRITAAEAMAHRNIALSALAHHGVAIQIMAPEIEQALAREWRGLLREVAATSRRAMRIDASYRAFRDRAGAPLA